MEINRISLYMLIAALNLAAINAAQAEDFNFTVPVRMNNLLPEIDTISVYCGALREIFPPTVGQKRITVPILDSGNLSMDVTVSFNAFPDRDPSSATRYMCEFSVGVGDGFQVPTPNASQPHLQPKPGTPFARYVEGTIP